jgi:hypothetical protein
MPACCRRSRRSGSPVTRNVARPAMAQATYWSSSGSALSRGTSSRRHPALRRQMPSGTTFATGWFCPSTRFARSGILPAVVRRRVVGRYQEVRALCAAQGVRHTRDIEHVGGDDFGALRTQCLKRCSGRGRLLAHDCRVRSTYQRRLSRCVHSSKDDVHEAPFREWASSRVNRRRVKPGRAGCLLRQLGQLRASA